MRYPLLAMGLLSASLLASTAAPSLSLTLTGSPLNAGTVWSDAGHDNAVDDNIADKELLWLAQVGPATDHHEGRRGERGGPQQGHGDRCRTGHAEPDHDGPYHENRGHHQFGLDLAERLAATEIYVGITSAQFDAWRAYSTALIDFFARPDRVGVARDRNGDGSSAGQEQMKTHDNAQGPLLAERLAQGAIAQAGRAEVLKTAVATLRASLSVDQIEKLATVEQAADPHHPPHDSFHEDISGHCDRPHGELPLPSRDE